MVSGILLGGLADQRQQGIENKRASRALDIQERSIEGNLSLRDREGRFKEAQAERERDRQLREAAEKNIKEMSEIAEKLIAAAPDAEAKQAIIDIYKPRIEGVAFGAGLPGLSASNALTRINSAQTATEAARVKGKASAAEAEAKIEAFEAETGLKLTDAQKALVRGIHAPGSKITVSDLRVRLAQKIERGEKLTPGEKSMAEFLSQTNPMAALIGSMLNPGGTGEDIFGGTGGASGPQEASPPPINPEALQRNLQVVRGALERGMGVDEIRAQLVEKARITPEQADRIIAQAQGR